MEEERERLYKVDSLEVLDYVKQSVEILMNMKADEYEQFLKSKQAYLRIMEKQTHKE